MPKQKSVDILTIIIVVLGFILLVGGLIVWGIVSSLPSTSLQEGNSSGTETEAEVFDLSESTFDFGTISMSKGKVEHIFQIKNSKAQSVTLERIYTSCMCTSAILMKDGKEFGPFGMQGHGYIPKINQNFSLGDKAEVKVIFDPGAHGPAGIGYVERTVYLETSLGIQQLKIKAKVTP